MVKELEVFLKKKINLTLNWEHFMNIFLNKNLIKFNNTINSEWIEIDTKQDYVRAVSMFKK